MENITDRRRNPFGMRPRCPGVRSVCGYGDPSADFHVIGDHSGVHGGSEMGIPFTRSRVGRRLQSVLYEVGFLDEAYHDVPAVSNLYMSYLFLCAQPPGSDPTPQQYVDHDRFFDAELRAVNAHVLLPVGRRACDRVLAEYTTRERKLPREMNDRHALDVRGRGFLVIPIKSPEDWTVDDRTRLVSRLTDTLASDYRQTKGVATLIG